MADLLEKLGRRVRHFRLGKNLTQEGVAELCDLSAKYISDLERGKANITVIVLEKVAVSLGITALDLLANEHEAERAALVKEIARFLDTADETKVRILYRMMKAAL